MKGKGLKKGVKTAMGGVLKELRGSFGFAVQQNGGAHAPPSPRPAHAQSGGKMAAGGGLALLRAAAAAGGALRGAGRPLWGQVRPGGGSGRGFRGLPGPNGAGRM